MKKLFLLTLLLCSFTLTSCKLVVEPSETTTTQPKVNHTLYGFKIYRYVYSNGEFLDTLDPKQSTFEFQFHENHFVNGENIYFQNVHIDYITKTINNEKTINEIVIESDFYVEMDVLSTYSLGFIFKDQNGQLDYEKPLNGTDSYYPSILNTQHIGGTIIQNEKEYYIKFIVHYKDLDELKQYSIIQYDESFNKIKEENIVLEENRNKKIDYKLNSGTVYFKIVETYLDPKKIAFTNSKLYTVDDLNKTVKKEIDETVYHLVGINDWYFYTINYTQ